MNRPSIPKDRLADSARKIRHPFALDPSLVFYSPQDNLDALAHPRVAEWLKFVINHWIPTPVQATDRRIALLIPCTKSKPYPTSREHRAINSALLSAGWSPTGSTNTPTELLSVLSADESPDVLDTSPLVKNKVVLDRFVVSEPLAVVPYEHVYLWNGTQSVATSYDDPGLFESRGTSVSPERSDCTAVPIGNGKWKWGPTERDAYVEVHNALSGFLVQTFTRLSPHYSSIVAWLSPGMTHRSFIADRASRPLDHLPASRRGKNGSRSLVGVLDQAPGMVELLPTRDQLDNALTQLAGRLHKEGRPTTPGSIRSVFARGDGHDTPLGLPEMLNYLVGHLESVSK